MPRCGNHRSHHQMMSVSPIILQTILAAAAGMFFFSCKNDPGDIRALELNEALPAQTIMDGEYDFTSNGRLRNKLYAKQMDHYLGKDAHLHVSGGFRLVTYSSKGEQESEMTAEEGFFYESKRIMTAVRNVHLANANGNELFTEELTWMQDSSRVFTEKRVRIVRKGSVIYGEGLTADDTFSKYEISKPTGEFEVEKEKIKE